MLIPDSASQREDGKLAAKALVSITIEPPNGLSAAEARLRLAQFGPNEPAAAKRAATVFQLLLLFANPLAIILLAASAISAALGEVINASIIAMMVLLSVALNFIQTYRSQKAVDRIRKEVAPTASVLRDGKWVEIPRREVVPGDVIKLALRLCASLHLARKAHRFHADTFGFPAIHCRRYRHLPGSR